jgi:hypothetical protein
MFEGIVSDLVLKICGDYVQDLNKEQLNISIWSGAFRGEACVPARSFIDHQ